MRRLGEGSKTGKTKPIKAIRATQSHSNVGNSISTLVTPIECYDTSRQLIHFIPNFWQFWDLRCIIPMIPV
ncbi:hypothetical protein L208DRAFT_1404925 [Tricholoma matsutake]|nr:hypothetical protein L208DRAFT_1404925 [Tricholoma matsutake 945]